MAADAIPAITRATRVLDLLAARPSRLMTMSEIARELDLSKSTCHAVLRSLEARGYLTRDPRRRTFTLGPALIPLGTQAERQLPAIAVVRPAIENLSQSLGVSCNVSAPVDGELVVIAHAGPPMVARSSYRIPMTPPIGAVFVAWGSDELVDAWLALLARPISDDERAHWLAALRAIRERGFVAGARERTLDAHVQEMVEFPREGPYPGLSYLVGADSADAQRPIQVLSAPVFGPDATARVAITVGLPVGTTLENVGSISEPLLRAAGAATEAIDGRLPGATYATL